MKAICICLLLLPSVAVFGEKVVFMGTLMAAPDESKSVYCSAWYTVDRVISGRLDRTDVSVLFARSTLIGELPSNAVIFAEYCQTKTCDVYCGSARRGIIDARLFNNTVALRNMANHGDPGEAIVAEGAVVAALVERNAITGLERYEHERYDCGWAISVWVGDRFSWHAIYDDRDGLLALLKIPNL